MSEKLVFSVSDFVAVCNQILNVSLANVTIVGELSQFRISKNRWVYFDLKDEAASVRFFGTVYQLPGPLEDGMVLRVRGVPQLHPQYGFSVTVQSIELSGEGTLKKAAQLLEAKLRAEGLFAPERKRPLPYPPQTIGLITSGESAAYADFIKILNERWVGVEVQHVDVQVQGEQAPMQIVEALHFFNAHANPPEVLVITRGGGSMDDLQAFSTEAVTRAVAASRIPTLVAIGHEVDLSLAELAADQRASTPSNAAQMLVPEKQHVLVNITQRKIALSQSITEYIRSVQRELHNIKTGLQQSTLHTVALYKEQLESSAQALALLNPKAVLKRGYAIVRKSGVAVRSHLDVVTKDRLSVELQDGIVHVTADEK